jgi:sugar/nucleoside kinase (ribokinase family)
VLAVPGEAPVRIPAHPAHVRDTTGAGDAFCAAFLSRWLADIDDPRSRRPDLARAADFAARTAAKVVTRLGARPV